MCTGLWRRRKRVLWDKAGFRYCICDVSINADRVKACSTSSANALIGVFAGLCGIARPLRYNAFRQKVHLVSVYTQESASRRKDREYGKQTAVCRITAVRLVLLYVRACNVLTSSMQFSLCKISTDRCVNDGGVDRSPLAAFICIRGLDRP